MMLIQFPEKIDHGIINKFMQKFYGQGSTSWSGKDRYHSHGFMGDFPHIKLLVGIIIIMKDHRNNVPGLLGSFSLSKNVRGRR